MTDLDGKPRDSPLTGERRHPIRNLAPPSAGYRTAHVFADRGYDGRSGLAAASGDRSLARPTDRMARRCRSLQHRRDQRHNRGEIDLPAEKAQRWRDRPLAAAIRGTTKLKRRSYSLSKPAGPPRALRGNPFCRAANPASARLCRINCSRSLSRHVAATHDTIPG